MPSFLSPLLQTPDAGLVLRNSRDNALLATRLEPAFDSVTRRRGLLGRTVFDEGGALILAPCSSIHTFFMRMAIDALFVSRNGDVLDTRSAMPAWRIAVALRAFAVIELPPGTVDRFGVRRGDVVLVASE